MISGLEILLTDFEEIERNICSLSQDDVTIEFTPPPAVCCLGHCAGAIRTDAKYLIMATEPKGNITRIGVVYGTETGFEFRLDETDYSQAVKEILESYKSS